MKRKIILQMLLLIGATWLLAGCETTSKISASVAPDFPPAPPNELNAPQLSQMGEKY